MDNEIKVLFTSDVHLGLNNDDLKVPESIRINTFKKITSLAREHDIMLIGGDLVDNVDVDRSIIDLIRNEFSGIRENETEIIYTPGFGEIEGNGVVADFLFDLNLSHIFSNLVYSSPYVFSKGTQKLQVYGMPASSDLEISRISKESDEGFHLGLFHSDFNQEKRKSEFKSMGLDFYALGHSHNFKMFKILDRIIGAHPGSPEATSPDETGDRYIISILIRDDEIFQIKRLSVNSVRLKEVEFDCSEFKSQKPMIHDLKAMKSQKEILRIVLTGERNFVLDHEGFESLREAFFDLEIADRSVPTVDSLVRQYSGEDSIRGKFFKILGEKLKQGGLPEEIDVDDFPKILNILVKDGIDPLEGWLCDISNA